MITNLEPVHYDFNDCYQDQIATIVEWNGDNYINNQLFRWNFCLEQYEEVYSDNIISFDEFDFVISKVWHPVRNFEYLGIVNKHIVIEDVDKAIERMKEELSNQKLLICNIKANECPWNPNYHRNLNNHIHVIILNGYDSDSKGFLCVDGWFNKKNIIINMQDFISGYMGSFDVIEVHKQKTQLDISSMLKKQAENFRANKQLSNMRRVVDIIRKCDFQQTINVQNNNNCNQVLYDKMEGSQFFEMLGELILSRKAVYEVLKINHFENIELQDKFKKASDKWQILKGKFVKACFLNKFNAMKEKIVELFESNILFEENLVDLILNNMDASLVKKQETEEIKGIINKIEYLNLEPHFNNNGIGTRCSEKSKFIITGEYFLKPDEDIKILSVANMKFNFPSCSDFENDNIICDGQHILVDKKISYIMFLACAEWGNFEEDIILQGLEEEKIEISVSDFYGEANFGESLAYEFQVIKRNDKTVEIASFTGNIFAKAYKVHLKDAVREIILPKCNNIHIFAISIGI